MTVSQAITIGNKFNSVLNTLELTTLFNQLRSQFSNLRAYLQQTNQNQVQANVSNTRTALENSMNEIQPHFINIDKYLAENLSFENYQEIKTILDKLQNGMSKFRKSVPVGGINAAVAIPLVLEVNTQFDTISHLQSIFNLASRYTNDLLQLPENLQQNTLSVSYSDEALITKLSELSIATKDWGFILNCFARLVNETDTDCEVVSVRRGSLILTIIAVPSIIAAICKCSDRIIASFLVIMSAKQKVLELKKLQVFTDLEIANMEKKVTINLTKQANEITQGLLLEFMPDKTHPDYHETKTAVLKAVKMLIKFEGKGGRIDAVLLESNPDYQNIVKGLKEKNAQFALLKNNVSALGEGKSFLQLEEGTDENNTEAA